MDDGIDTAQIDLVGLAHVALDHRQAGRRRQIVAKPLIIEGNHLMTDCKQLRHEDRTLVTTCTRDENLHMALKPSAAADEPLLGGPS